MKFTKWVFSLAGISGILIVAPLYFVEEQFGKDNPPPINHPEFFYGFAGVTLAWQVIFLLIGLDPVRYRLAILPAILEKVSFAVAIPVLYFASRVDSIWLGAASMDATWAVLFVIAFLRTPKDALVQFADGAKDLNLKTEGQ